MSFLKHILRGLSMASTKQEEHKTSSPPQTDKPTEGAAQKNTVVWKFKSEDWMREEGRLAEVNGLPTYEYADTHKHDLTMMLQCCEAHEKTYWSQPKNDRFIAAPFYFMRAAILYRKQKLYNKELVICERWKRIVEDYQEQPKVKTGKAAIFTVDDDRIVNRIQKAHKLLEKQNCATSIPQQ